MKTILNYRMIGDAQADDLFHKVLDTCGVETVHTIIKALFTQKQNSTDYLLKDKALINDYEAFRNTVSTLPVWADQAKMARASKIFQLYRERILLILLCKSLPTSYANAKLAKVLNVASSIHENNGIHESTTRSLIETAQFYFTVLGKDSFDKNGSASKILEKARLTCAAIRIHAKNTDWDYDTYDVPFNQEDLAFTILCYSSVVIDGLEQTGIHLPYKDKEAFMHFWKVVGFQLGIETDLLVDKCTDGQLLAQEIFSRQKAHSEDGQILTANCISFMQQMLKTHLWQNEPARMIRFLLGDETSNLLGIDISKSINWPTHVLENMFDRQENEKGLVNSMFRGVVYLMSHTLIAGLRTANMSVSESFFDIPSSKANQRTQLEFPAIPVIKHIEEAIYYQKLLTDHFQEENNPMGYFAAIYWLVTRRVRDGINNGSFKLPDMMEKVDVGFANRYFTAINAYFAGKPATGPWQLSFDAAKRKDLIVNQHVFVAANAHISFDLGITVAEVFTPDTVLTFNDDFLTMNALFMGMYTQMNQDIHRVSWQFAVIMDVMKGAYVSLENFFMAIARDRAWSNALTISLAGANKPQVIAQLENEAVTFGKSLVDANGILKKMETFTAHCEYGTVADRIAVMERSNLIKGLS